MFISKPLNVLIIDDSIGFRLIATQLILTEWPNAIVREYDPVQTNQFPDDEHLENIDVILLDYEMGPFEGLHVLQHIRNKKQHLPIIFVTACGNESIAVQAIKGGANDYIKKDDLSKKRLAQSMHEVLKDTHDKDETIGFPKELTNVNFPIEPKINVAIDGYRIIKRIGRGGMATIYLAENTEKNIVALKVLDFSDKRRSGSIERFIIEHASLSKLDNPYIVKIYDFGYTEEHAYIAMEYLSGGDLKQKNLSIESRKEALAIFKQILMAIEDVHRTELIHRDLKPQNIMFRKDGTVALIDFGVVKLLNSMTELTLHGQIIGSPSYMSPEQGGQGESIDIRTDLYSLGIILYEMLMKELPYRASSVAALIYKHYHEPVPDLNQENSDLQIFLNKLMAKKTDERFNSVTEALEVFDTCLN